MNKLILIFLLLIVVQGCVKVEDNFHENINNDNVVSKQNLEETTTTNNSSHEYATTNVVEEDSRTVEDTYIIGKFIEINASNPSSFEFSEHTLVANLNVCTGFDSIEGEYIKNEDSLEIWFEDAKGYPFLEGVSFKFSLIDQFTLKLSEGQAMSCTGNTEEVYIME